jgi:enoyl-CoA hydratase
VTTGVSDALDHLAADEAVRVVIVTGAGTVFSAGFDLTEFNPDHPEPDERLWASSDRFHHAVLQFPLTTVAAVNGPAIAGGFDLAVLCDLRVAADTAWFSHPEREHFSVVYSPLEALDLHLVSRVVPADEIAAAARDTAAQIAVAPRPVLLQTKGKALARAGINATTPTLDL